MKILLQRVHNATITINHDHKRSIGKGIVVYIGLSKNSIIQAQEKTQKAVSRLLNIGLFTDDNGKMKRSLSDIAGDLLLVSNFTLHGRNKKGNQIDFTQSAPYQQAQEIYNNFVETVRQQYTGGSVQTGKFGAYMQIDSSLDGPVNIVLDY